MADDRILENISKIGSELVPVSPEEMSANLGVPVPPQIQQATHEDVKGLLAMAGKSGLSDIGIPEQKPNDPEQEAMGIPTSKVKPKEQDPRQKMIVDLRKELDTITADQNYRNDPKKVDRVDEIGQAFMTGVLPGENPKDHMSPATKFLAGAGIELARLSATAINGVQDIANWLSVNTGGEPTDKPLFEKLDMGIYKDLTQNQATSEKAGEFVMRYGLPMLATGGVGTTAFTAANLAKVTAAEAVSAFFLQDPHQKHLISLLDEPENAQFKEHAIMADAVAEADQTGELAGRFKNALEATILTPAIFGTVLLAGKQVAKVYQAYKGGAEAAQKAAQEAAYYASEQKHVLEAVRPEGMGKNMLPRLRDATEHEASLLNQARETMASTVAGDVEHTAAQSTIDQIQKSRLEWKESSTFVDAMLNRPTMTAKTAAGKDMNFINPHLPEFEAVLNGTASAAVRRKLVGAITKIHGDVDELTQGYLADGLRKVQLGQAGILSKEEFQALHKYVLTPFEYEAAISRNVAANAKGGDLAESALRMISANTRATKLRHSMLGNMSENLKVEGAVRTWRELFGDLSNQMDNALERGKTTPIGEGIDGVQKDIPRDLTNEQFAFDFGDQPRVGLGEPEAARPVVAKEPLTKEQQVQEAFSKTRDRAGIAPDITKNIPATEYFMYADQKFRSGLMNGFLAKFGGEQKAGNMMNYIKSLDQYIGTPTLLDDGSLRFINGLEAGEAEAIHDQVSQALRSTSTDKIIDTLNSIQRKMMLSSPRSAMSAFLGNSIMTFKTAVDVKLASKLAENSVAKWGPSFEKVMSEHVAFDTVAEELAHDSARFSEGIFSGMRAMWDATKKSAGERWQYFKTGKEPLKETAEGLMEAPKLIQIKRPEIRPTPMSPNQLGMDATTMAGTVFQETGAIIDSTLGVGEKLLGKSDDFYAEILGNAKLREMMSKRTLNELKTAGTTLSSEEMEKEISRRIRMASIHDLEEVANFTKPLVMANALPIDSTSTLRGGLANIINNMNDQPLTRALFPFLRSSFNIMDSSFNHTFLRAVWDRNELAQTLAKGGRDAYIAQAQMLSGSGVVGMAAAMYGMGYLTGPPPANPRQERALYEANEGWKPYSIKIGNTYIDYRQLEPLSGWLRLGTLMGAIGPHLDDHSFMSNMALAGAVVAESMRPQALLEEPAEMISLIQEMARGKVDEGAGNRMIRSYLDRLVPAAAKDMKKYTDNYKRDMTPAKTDGLFDMLTTAYKAQVPWLDSESMAVSRNLFGKPLLEKERLGPDWAVPLPFSKSTDERDKMREVLNLFAKAEFGMEPDKQLVKLALSMPSRAQSFNKIRIELDNHEYEKFNVAAAGYIYDENGIPGKERAFTTPLEDVFKQQLIGAYSMIKANGGKMSPMIYNNLVGTLNQASRTYRETAKAMLMQDPKFADKFSKAVRYQTTPSKVGNFGAGPNIGFGD